MIALDYCSMVRYNLYDFLKAAETYASGCDDKIVKVNRHIMNWLNSFYTWIEYHERHNKNIFSAIKKKYFDEFFEYRFAYILRKFTTHQAMCIDSISFDVINERASFRIGLSNILCYKKDLKKSIVDELEAKLQKEEHVDAVAFSRNFLSMFEKMQKEIWESEQLEIDKKLIGILESVQDVSQPIADSYISSDGEEMTFPVGYRVHRYLCKMKERQIPQCLCPYLIKN